MNNIEFNRFGIMLDASRNAVMNVNTLKKYIDIMARLGYNCLMLYTEDTYEIKSQPYFGHKRGRYTEQEIKEIDSYAISKGIELMPCIQTLAHLNAIMRWPIYGEIRDCDDILLSGDDRTYALIEEMFKTISENFTSRTVNIGMDEAHMLGKGKYQEINGYENRFDILLKHLNKVSEIAKKYDLELLMWGDMFFRLINNGNYEQSLGDVPDYISDMIPSNVSLIYWDYYSTKYENYNVKIKAHKAVKDNIWFAGGLWSWCGLIPHNDYSIRATKAAFDACRDNNVKDVILTLWGDDGAECSKFSLLPSMYYAAQLAKGITDEKTIKSGFEKEFNIKFDEFMAIDLLGTPNENENIINSDKYFLYNDCFMGLFDNLEKEEYRQEFKKAADKLEQIDSSNEFYYVFDSAKKLSKLLSVKTNIANRTRKAYFDKDIDSLKKIISEYDELLVLLEEFYDAFEKQWMIENKPHGFDVQDIRLGGLLLRAKHCKDRLNKFILGEIEEIAELCEPPLDFFGREPEQRSLVQYFKWVNTATPNNI